MIEESLSNAQKVFQILLLSGDSVRISELEKQLSLKIDDTLIEEIRSLATTCGLNFISSKNEFTLSLHPIISKLKEDDDIKSIKQELSDSALETLAVILYKESATKAEIDFVRGVDSSRSLQTLTLRGLIEKNDIKNKKVYSPSVETLMYLNIDKSENLIRHAEISEKFKELIHGA